MSDGPLRALDAEAVEWVLLQADVRAIQEMTAEKRAAALRDAGYDEGRLDGAIESVFASAGVAVPGEMSVAAAIERAMLHAGVATIDAMGEAERGSALKEAGYDAGAMDAAIARAFEDAGLPVPGVAQGADQGEASEGGHGAGSKVTSLAEARQRRSVVSRAASRTTRWVPFLAAAAVLLMVGGGLTQRAVDWRPTPTVTYPTYVPPPSAAEVAARVRERAARLCALQYFGQCEDELDRAKKVDPAGEESEAVKGLRERIRRGKEGVVLGAPKEGMVKELGPGERPLQRH